MSLKDRPVTLQKAYSLRITVLTAIRLVLGAI